MATVSANSNDLARKIQEALKATSSGQYIIGKWVSADVHTTEEDYTKAVDEISRAQQAMWHAFYNVMGDYQTLSHNYDAVCATLNDIQPECNCGMPSGRHHESDCAITRQWVEINNGRVKGGYMPSREGMPNFD